MILDKKEKQPSEVKDYPIDYSPWLAEISDTILSITTSVSCTTLPANSTLSVSSSSFTLTAVKVWLSGGTDKSIYKVTINVTTSGGRIDQSEFIMKIKEY